jgi:hypothetical protein
MVFHCHSSSAPFVIVSWGQKSPVIPVNISDILLGEKKPSMKKHTKSSENAPVKTSQITGKIGNLVVTDIEQQRNYSTKPSDCTSTAQITSTQYHRDIMISASALATVVKFNKIMPILLILKQLQQFASWSNYCTIIFVPPAFPQVRLCFIFRHYPYAAY